jgi:hypothetical protein
LESPSSLALGFSTPKILLKHTYCVPNSNNWQSGLMMRSKMAARLELPHCVSDDSYKDTNNKNGVLIQTPCYDEFAKKMKETGRRVLDNRLICGPDGRYTIDLDDFEKKASDPRARLFLLCSPHNPTGRVWTSLA